MRYFMKFYLDSTTGTVEQVDDSMTLLSGNDEKGVFNWIEVFDKQQLAQAHREADSSAKDAFKRGWEQGKGEAAKVCHVHRSNYGVGGEYIADGIGKAIAAMEYKEKVND